MRSTRSDTGSALDEEAGKVEKGTGERRGVGVRPRRMGPADTSRSFAGGNKGTSDWLVAEGGGGAAGGTPMASSCTGGSNIGRDMVTAARLITCVGDDCQAISQRSDGHPTHPAKPERVQDGGQEEERRGRKERENGGRHERSGTGTLFAPRDAAGKGAVLNRGPGRAYGGRHDTGGCFGSCRIACMSLEPKQSQGDGRRVLHRIDRRKKPRDV